MKRLAMIAALFAACLLSACEDNPGAPPVEAPVIYCGEPGQANCIELVEPAPWPDGQPK